MKFCILNKNYKRKIIIRAKKKLRCHGIREFSKKIGVSKSSLLNYMNHESKMPLSLYDKLSRIVNLRKNPLTIEIKNTKKEIKNPILNTNLAEFLGIIAGDGHISGISYEVSITGHMVLDREFIMEKVCPLFVNLFDIQPHIQIQPNYNKIKCLVYSKALATFLNKDYDLPIGAKKNVLRVPKKIMKNKKLTYAFIRGVFDTDGSFHRHHKKDAALELISGYKNFLNDLAIILESIKFHPSVGKKRLFLYRKEEIDRFFNLIKPANLKHSKRYKRYKNTGKI